MANAERNGFFGGLIGKLDRSVQDVQPDIEEDQIEIRPEDLYVEPQPRTESKDDVFAGLNYDERVALSKYIKGRAEGELADDRLENVSNYARLLVDEVTGDVYIPGELDNLSHDFGYGPEDLVFFVETDKGFTFKGPTLEPDEDAKAREREKMGEEEGNIVHFPAEMIEGERVDLGDAAGDD